MTLGRRRERRAFAERKENGNATFGKRRSKLNFKYLLLNTSCKMTAEQCSANRFWRGDHKGDVQ